MRVQLGLALTRADAVNDHPRFLDTMADVVLATVRRHVPGMPLTMAHVAAVNSGAARSRRCAKLLR